MTKKGKAKPRLCPKCGSEMIRIERLDDDKYAKGESPYSNLCQKCGHEEKVEQLHPLFLTPDKKVGGEKSVH